MESLALFVQSIEQEAVIQSYINLLISKLRQAVENNQSQEVRW